MLEYLVSQAEKNYNKTEMKKNKAENNNNKRKAVNEDILEGNQNQNAQNHKRSASPLEHHNNSYNIKSLGLGLPSIIDLTVPEETNTKKKENNNDKNEKMEQLDKQTPTSKKRRPRKMIGKPQNQVFSSPQHDCDVIPPPLIPFLLGHRLQLERVKKLQTPQALESRIHEENKVYKERELIREINSKKIQMFKEYNEYKELKRIQDTPLLKQQIELQLNQTEPKISEKYDKLRKEVNSVCQEFT